MKKGGNLMKCSNCNKEIEDGSAFCAFCGAKVENDTKVQETVPEVEETPVEDVKEEKAETTEQAANEEVKVEAVRILQEFVQGKILKENRKKLYSFRFSFCL